MSDRHLLGGNSSQLVENVPHQDEDVLQASLVKFLHHLCQIPESQGVIGEDPAFVCVIQVIPLHILKKKKKKKTVAKKALLTR